MSGKEKKGLFRACATCSKKRLYTDDPHADCIYCLYPDHQAKDCKVCRTFSSKTLRDREGCLLIWLQKLKTRKEVISSDSDEASSSSSRRSQKRRSPHAHSSEERPEKALKKTTLWSSGRSPSKSP